MDTNGERTGIALPPSSSYGGRAYSCSFVSISGSLLFDCFSPVAPVESFASVTYFAYFASVAFVVFVEVNVGRRGILT